MLCQPVDGLRSDVARQNEVLGGIVIVGHRFRIGIHPQFGRGAANSVYGHDHERPAMHQIGSPLGVGIPGDCRSRRHRRDRVATQVVLESDRHHHSRLPPRE